MSSKLLWSKEGCCVFQSFPKSDCVLPNSLAEYIYPDRDGNPWYRSEIMCNKYDANGLCEESRVSTVIHANLRNENATYFTDITTQEKRMIESRMRKFVDLRKLSFFDAYSSVRSASHHEFILTDEIGRFWYICHDVHWSNPKYSRSGREEKITVSHNLARMTSDYELDFIDCDLSQYYQDEVRSRLKRFICAFNKI